MATIAYARTTSHDHFIRKQLETLKSNKYSRLYVEPYTPFPESSELQQAVDALNQGDYLLIYRLDCLGKTMLQLQEFIAFLKNKGANLRSLVEDLDTTNPSGQTYLEFLGYLAEMERNVATENTIKGLERARKLGKTGGRPALTDEKIKQIRTMYFEQSCSLRKISEVCGVSIGSVHKYVRSISKDNIKQ